MSSAERKNIVLRMKNIWNTSDEISLIWGKVGEGQVGMIEV